MPLNDAFPKLTPANHRLVSPPTTDYNCVAWAAEDSAHWWQPGKFWPYEASPRDFGIDALERALQTLGFERCLDGALEVDFQKLALYATDVCYTHVARQLPNGKWTSKLGKAEDIEHDTPEVLEGLHYGKIVLYMRRLSGSNS